MRNSWVLFAAAALVTTGCTSTIARLKSDGPKLDYREYAGEPVQRFTAFDIDSWQPVSRNQLVVWTGVNDAYLVTVWDNCQDLQYAERVGVSRTGNTVTKFDTVHVRDQRCPISDIRPVDVKRLKADRAAARAQAKPAASTTEAAASDAAPGAANNSPKN